MVYDGLMAWRRRQRLIFFGYSDAEILRLGDLTKLTNERMKELIDSNSLEAMEKHGEEAKGSGPIIMKARSIARSL